MRFLISQKSCWIGLFLSSCFLSVCRGQGIAKTSSETRNPSFRRANQSQSKVLAEGDAAPKVSFVGLSGKTFRLSELTDRGKNVVFVFSRAHW